MSGLEKKKKSNEKVYIKRLLAISVISTIMLLLLIGRLFYIQIINNEVYTAEVNRQRRLHIPIDSGRGRIYDRNWIPLTDRREKTVAVIFPRLFIMNEDSVEFLNKITGIPKETLTYQISISSNPVEFDVVSELDWSDRKLFNTKGLFVVYKTVRYEENPLLSHVIGYINSVDGNGMSGLEKSFDSILTNHDTRSVMAIVDGRKRILPGEGYKIDNTLHNQNNIQLTIDYHIQKIIEEAMDKYQRKGAVIVSKVDTGEILAMCSRPNFNPNRMIDHLSSSGDELYNKGVQMSFPPGSVFKIVVTAEALRQNQLDLEEVFYCSGVEKVGNIEIRCNAFEQGGHEEITFKEAFAHSCNSVFIQMGQKLGAKNIIQMAERLGLGREVEIGLLEEEKGYLPMGDHLFGPAIGNISIGQGQIEVTALQINQMTQIIGNHGIKKPLYLVDHIVDHEYRIIEKLRKEEEEQIIQEEDVKILHYLMKLVMTEGTGKEVGLLSDVTAGKTGTAQSSRRGQSVLHAWFTGYYYTDKPQYAITVFVQDGGSGGKAAVPIFKEIVEDMIRLGY